MADSRNSKEDDGVRRCTVCGEPVYTREQTHPECAAKCNPPLTKPGKPPQKTCPQCGHKVHVRKLVCDGCGAMF